jgi:hypothetical protein
MHADIHIIAEAGHEVDVLLWLQSPGRAIREGPPHQREAREQGHPCRSGETSAAATAPT